MNEGAPSLDEATVDASESHEGSEAEVLINAEQTMLEELNEHDGASRINAERISMIHRIGTELTYPSEEVGLK